MLCHGGSGTTFGALAAGVPLAAIPMFADQPVNARLVAAAGAGLAVEPPSAADRTPRDIGDAAAEIRAALERVLTHTAYRHTAARLATEMTSLPSIDQLLATVVLPTTATNPHFSPYAIRSRGHGFRISG